MARADARTAVRLLSNELTELVLEEVAGPGGVDSHGAARGDAAPADRAGAVRLGARPHRHAAAVGRGDVLSAQPGRRAAGRGPRSEEERSPDQSASPIPTSRSAALVFKILADKHGDLHFVRVYSGRLKANSRVSIPGKDKKENAAQLWHIQADRREQVPIGRGRRHRRRHRPANIDHRRHALRLRRADPAGIDPVSRDGHLDGHRAGDVARAQEARRRAGDDEAAGPDVPRPRKRRDRPDDHQRHGRAAPGGDQAPPAARFQSQRARPQAAGQLQGNGRQAGRGGRQMPAASRRASAVRRGQGSRSRRATTTSRARCSRIGSPKTRPFAMPSPMLVAALKEHAEGGGLLGCPLWNCALEVLEHAVSRADARRSCPADRGGRRLHQGARSGRRRAHGADHGARGDDARGPSRAT